jgi:hypothetical protein
MPGRSFVSAVFVLLFALLTSATSTGAAAQSEVVVLGVRSVEGDDDVAHDLTTALRESAQDVSAWTVSSTAVSMAQMALAHGCEEVDVACLADIAKGLSADLVVYGTLRRNSAREDFDFAFNLSLFNAQTGAIQNSIDDTIVRRDTTKGALGPRAKRLIARLAGTEAPAEETDASLGSLVVRSNVDSADVLINDQPVGTLQGGVLQYDGLQEGMYRVELRAHGYAPFVKTVRIKAGQRFEFEAGMQVGASDRDPSLDWEDQEPRQKDGGHGLRWLGWTLVGVGAVSAVGLVVSWTQIIRINNDDRLERYSGEVAEWNRRELAAARVDEREPKLFDDFCEASKTYAFDGEFFQNRSKFKEVQGLCKDADTWEALQYVFLGTAVAAGGTGIVLLLTAGDGGERGANEPPRFALTPHVGPDRGGVQATFRF